MKLSLGLDRRLYGPDGATRYLWVRIEVPRRSSPTPRSPVDISLVLDRSGSMGGQKIELAKRAAVQAVNLLRETDRCGLVAYDDEIIRAVRCRPLDPAQRTALLQALQGLHARGSTDLFGGWLAGAEDIGDEEANRVRRVLLLTDGLANVGVTQPNEIVHHVRELSLRGVGTTTFGVGLDFDEVLVSGMAEAGNGHFFYVERPEQIPDYLSSELGELLTVAARSTTVVVAVSDGAQVHNLNDLPVFGAFYQLGDLSEGAVVDLHFLLDVPPAATGPLNIQVALAWQDPLTSAGMSVEERTMLEAADVASCEAEVPDRDVLGQAVKARAARTRNEALKRNHVGDYDGARKLVEDELAIIEPMSSDIPEAAVEVESLRDNIQEVSAHMGVASKKAMLYESYKARRSRVDPNR